MKPFLIIGGTSFGHLIETLIQACGYTVDGFVDDFNSGPRIVGRTPDLFSRSSANDFNLAMAIGYKHLATRLSMFNRLTEAGYKFPALIHPRALVSTCSTIGNGCILMAGANVDAFTTIQSLCVLWPGAIVSHDSQIGTNTFVSPNATLCGFVEIGESSFIGAGCVVVDGCSLPANSFVKAGSRYVSKRA